ncbi:hypothetical protein HALDL1_03230 [Halobacterium sp. DL1]|jgi:hypothetical protein|nr:hypothetical protein HALDL1_03230 [Halobacterium sp. DL1]
MAIERILVVVGPGNRDRVDRLAATTADLAGPMDATVSVARLSTDASVADRESGRVATS